MAEEEKTVPVNIRFGDVEVAANQGYQEGIKQVVHKFVQDLGPLARVRL
jgi:hypothetical protein